jgi:hypothetical protein
MGFIIASSPIFNLWLSTAAYTMDCMYGLCNCFVTDVNYMTTHLDLTTDCIYWLCHSFVEYIFVIVVRSQSTDSNSEHRWGNYAKAQTHNISWIPSGQGHTVSTGDKTLKKPIHTTNRASRWIVSTGFAKVASPMLTVWSCPLGLDDVLCAWALTLFPRWWSLSDCPLL